MTLTCSLCIAVLCVFIVAFAPRRAAAGQQDKLYIFYAGSLHLPVESMVKQFESLHSNIRVQCQAGGSTLLACKIQNQQAPQADIMASADYEIIDSHLIPNCASWNALFATNQMVLCHTDQSKYAAEITADNWYEILQLPDVSWAHSSPELDPCGYRSLMVLQLAEKFYEKDGLYNKLIANRPETNILAKASHLVERLKSGKLDYAFEYLSIALQHNLPYVVLDQHINLGNYQLTPFYKQAKIRMPGKIPETDIELEGASITYGVTMLDNAPNRSAALAFLQYLFDPQGGLAILRQMGQSPFVPVQVANEKMQSNLPEELRSLVKVAA